MQACGADGQPAAEHQKSGQGEGGESLAVCILNSHPTVDGN